MTFYVSSPFARAMAHRRMFEMMGKQIDEEECVMSLRVDVKDEGESYFVSAMVPGLKVEDLEITVVDDVVTIKGEFKADSEEEAKYLVQERPAGHFARSIRLPNSLASEKAEAHLENGILTLRIPKAEEAKPKKINVIAK